MAVNLSAGGAKSAAPLSPYPVVAEWSVLLATIMGIEAGSSVLLG